MSTSKTRPDVVALSPRAITEFLKPARIEVYESLQVSGPASIASLAERLGRAPESLYYHVRKLVELGVLEVVPEESTGVGSPGRNGALYATTSRQVRMDLDVTCSESRAAWAGGAAAVLRLAQRDAQAALERGDAVTHGARRNLLTQRHKARLDRRELARANRLIEELHGLMRAGAGKTRGQLFALTTSLSTLEDRTP